MSCLFHAVVTSFTKLSFRPLVWSVFHFHSASGHYCRLSQKMVNFIHKSEFLVLNYCKWSFLCTENMKVIYKSALVWTQSLTEAKMWYFMPVKSTNCACRQSTDKHISVICTNSSNFLMWLSLWGWRLESGKQKNLVLLRTNRRSVFPRRVWEK